MSAPTLNRPAPTSVRTPTCLQDFKALETTRRDAERRASRAYLGHNDLVRFNAELTAVAETFHTAADRLRHACSDGHTHRPLPPRTARSTRRA